ncbi:MAG: hypothetical protein GXO59_03325, partial [Dictyoglomi bacterium]|nr:hypothetical protein [Dictyoglomota bacterium]
MGRMSMKLGLTIMLIILLFIFGYGAYYTVGMIKALPGITPEAVKRISNFIWISSFGVWLLLTIFTIITYRLIVGPLKMFLEYTKALKEGKELPEDRRILTFPEIIQLKNELAEFRKLLVENLHQLSNDNKKLVENMENIM